MKALEVFTYSIHYLYTRALEVIKERTGDENFSHSDVQWVLTVPAIWKPAAKQFMREAAYQVRHSFRDYIEPHAEKVSLNFTNSL